MKQYYLTAFCILGVFIAGCDKFLPQESSRSLSTAHLKFHTICKEEYNIPTTIIPLENTVWIYAPIHESIISMKAQSQKGQSVVLTGKEKFAVNFIESSFAKNDFHVRYDIDLVRTYPKDLGYGSKYSQAYSKTYRQLLEGITRAYFDNTKPPIEFFVIVIADTINGIKNTSIMYLEDYKRLNNQSLPYEEYIKRVYTETNGDERIINNANGEGLDYLNVDWPDFLSKQIQNRINFKYQQSSLEPSLNVKQEVLNAVAQTLKAYSFNGYNNVYLHDLAQKTQEVFTSSAINQIQKSLQDANPGRWHTIEFDINDNDHKKVD